MRPRYHRARVRCCHEACGTSAVGCRCATCILLAGGTLGPIGPRHSLKVSDRPDDMWGFLKCGRGWRRGNWTGKARGREGLRRKKGWSAEGSAERLPKKRRENTRPDHQTWVRGKRDGGWGAKGVSTETGVRKTDFYEFTSHLLRLCYFNYRWSSNSWRNTPIISFLIFLLLNTFSSLKICHPTFFFTFKLFKDLQQENEE